MQHREVTRESRSCISASSQPGREINTVIGACRVSNKLAAAGESHARYIGTARIAPKIPEGIQNASVTRTLCSSNQDRAVRIARKGIVGDFEVAAGRGIHR